VPTDHPPGDTDPFYFERLAAAFVRGRLRRAAADLRSTHRLITPLEALTPADYRELIRLGLTHDLRLHRFKRTMGLPRVAKVLGILRGVRPASLLDIGSGRGAALWPLLDAFPSLPVTTVEQLPQRVADLGAVRAGGVATLAVVRADATVLPFADNAFDTVLLLEVLEHIPDAGQSLAEAARVGRRFLILSVPSRSDDNPEHLHLFSAGQLMTMLRVVGATRVTFDGVHNHLIAVARLGT